jgi:hypothetical protein
MSAGILDENNLLRAINYIKKYINVPRVSPKRPQKTKSLSSFYDKYLRRNVGLNLRSSAFICGFELH